MPFIPPTGVPSGTPSVKWWLVYYQLAGAAGGRGGGPGALGSAQSLFAIVSAPNKQVAAANVTRGGNVGVTKVVGPYPSKAAAMKAHTGDPLTNKEAGAAPTVGAPNFSVLNPASWITGLGGMIGSGIEGGIVSLFRDLWDVIIGPVEILIGALIAVFVLAIYFKDDIGGIMGTVAMAAA